MFNETADMDLKNTFNNNTMFLFTAAGGLSSFTRSEVIFTLVSQGNFHLFLYIRNY